MVFYGTNEKRVIESSRQVVSHFMSCNSTSAFLITTREILLISANAALFINLCFAQRNFSLYPVHRHCFSIIPSRTATLARALLFNLFIVKIYTSEKPHVSVNSCVQITSCNLSLNQPSLCFTFEHTKAEQRRSRKAPWHGKQINIKVESMKFDVMKKNLLVQHRKTGGKRQAEGFGWKLHASSHFILEFSVASRVREKMPNRR